MAADFAAWLTKREAAEHLGVSTKTVEQLAKAGQLHQAQRRRPETGQRVVVYHPDDVARLAVQRQPAGLAGFVVPDAPVHGNGKGHALTVTRPKVADADPVRTLANFLITAWTEAQEAQQAAKAAKDQKLFLTVAEAAAVTGLSRAYLRRAIRAQTLNAIRDRGWRIRRTDLEAL